MSKSSENESNPELLRRGRYHLRRLHSRTQAAPIAAAFAPVHGALVTALTIKDEAEFDASVARGAIAGAHADYAAAVSDVNSFVYAASGRKRKSAMYLDFFPTGSIKATTHADPTQDATSCKRLLDAAVKYPAAVPPQVLANLSAMSSEVTLAFTALDEAEKRGVAADQEVLKARGAWIPVYNESEPRLELLFPGRPGLVRSFFLATGAPPKKKKVG